MSRLPVVKPLGLVTQPNKAAMPAGALSRALNVCMRDPRVISSLPDVRTYRADVISNGYTLRRLFAADSNVLAFGDNAGTWAARWVSASASSAVTMPATTGFTSFGFETGCAQVARARDRYFITSRQGPVCIDGDGETTARMAGMQTPRLRLGWATSGATVLAADSAVKYAATISRTQDDGYATLSAPSNAVTLVNTTGSAVDPTVTILFASGGTVEEGDIVEIYRTRAVTPNTSEPGDTFYLAIRHVVTSGEVAANTFTVTDTTPEASLGEELYTNPGQQGATQSNLMPPLADDIAVFKGHTFYASRRLPSTLTVKVKTVIGLLSTAAEREHGLGQRQITGDISSGSDTVLNVSDMTGIVPGQRVSGTGIPAGTSIVSIDASSFTMSANATATTATLAITANDVVVEGHDVAVFTSEFGSLRSLLDDQTVFVDADKPARRATSISLSALENVDGPSLIFRSRFYKDGQLEITATNGQNYQPPLEEYGSASGSKGSYDERLNRFHWSKSDQPEAVPPLNYGFVGNGTLLRMIPTRDALYMFCTDGLYRLSGVDGEWRVDPLDPNLVLAARNAVATLNDVIWAYTDRGLVSIEGDAVREHTRGVIGDLVPGAAYADTWDTFLACDELHREVWLTFRSGDNSVSYVYNTLTDAFTTVDDDEWSCMAYSRALQSLVIGAVSSNPDVLYFEDDTSGTRMPGADVRFQPFEMGDPFTTKEFHDVDYIFGGMGSSAATLVPTFSGTAYQAVTVPQSSLASHGRVMVPRNAPAVGTSIAPGFTLSAGGTAQNWHFRGLSVRFDVVSEEFDRR